MGSAANLGVEPDDRWLCCLPLNHVGGLSILIRSAIYGTAAMIHDGFDVDRVAAALGAGEITIALARPDAARAAARRRGRRSTGPGCSWSAAGRSRPTSSSEALGRGATVVQTYGLTEACSQVCTLGAGGGPGPTPAPRAGRCPAIEVRIESDEILVRGPTVAPGVASPTTAGSTPATSAGSTTTASSGSRAGATT